MPILLCLGPLPLRVRQQDLHGAAGQPGLGPRSGGGAPVPGATRILTDGDTDINRWRHGY